MLTGLLWRAGGCNANSAEQYITASLLYLAEKYDSPDLTKQTIGIVGLATWGQGGVACEKLGMRVLLNDPPREER